MSSKADLISTLKGAQKAIRAALPVAAAVQKRADQADAAMEGGKRSKSKSKKGGAKKTPANKGKGKKK